MGKNRKLWVRITAIAITAFMLLSSFYMAIVYLIH